MTKFRFSLLFIVVFTLIFTAQTVLAADIGPKPTMEFEFQQDSSGENISITSGVLYECQQADCSDAAPLEELGPQRFYCEEFRCSALGYGFAPYHRIEIQFSDGKTRQSNIFETIDFQSYYIVTINPDDLFVEESFGSPAPPFEEPFPEETFEPSSGGRNSMPRVMLGFGVLLCVGLVSLLAVGLVIFFFVRRSRTK
jgi:hypothetical protein